MRIFGASLSEPHSSESNTASLVTRSWLLPSPSAPSRNVAAYSGNAVRTNEIAGCVETSVRVSLFGGLEWTTGLLEWTTGTLEWTTGTLEWNTEMDYWNGYLFHKMLVRGEGWAWTG